MKKYTTIRGVNPPQLEVLGDVAGGGSAQLSTLKTVAKLTSADPEKFDRSTAEGRKLHGDPDPIGSLDVQPDILLEGVERSIDEFLSTIEDLGTTVVACCSPDIPEEIDSLLTHPLIKKLSQTLTPKIIQVSIFR